MPKAKRNCCLVSTPKIPEAWCDKVLAEKWEKIRSIRRVVTGAIELERKEKRIGSSLQAHPIVHAQQEDISLFDNLDAAELFITSGATFTKKPIVKKGFSLIEVPHVTVIPNQAKGEKCERCWKILPEVGIDSEFRKVCGRCTNAVRHLKNDV